MKKLITLIALVSLAFTACKDEKLPTDYMNHAPTAKIHCSPIAKKARGSRGFVSGSLFYLNPFYATHFGSISVYDSDGDLASYTILLDGKVYREVKLKPGDGYKVPNEDPDKIFGVSFGWRGLFGKLSKGKHSVMLIAKDKYNNSGVGHTVCNID